MTKLQLQMGQQQEGAKEVISQWEDRCNLLQENLSAVEEAREEAEASLVPLEDDLVVLKKELEDLKGQSVDAVEQWQGE